MLVSKYPISKEEALKYKAKDITITNTSTCDTAYYKVTIKDLVNSSINKDKINYQVIDKSTNTETIDKNPDNFNISDSLTKGNTKTYTIRLWIDESATNTDLFINGDTTKPIEYKYALNIESSDEKLKGDITPALEFAKANVGQNGLEQITHTIDNTLQVDERFATEYRYRGGNSVVKNYVTFNNETWRIIGVIPTEDTDGNVENRFKIVRNNYIGGALYWDNNNATAYNYKNDESIKTLKNHNINSNDINNLIYYNNDYNIIKTAPPISQGDGCTDCSNNWARPSTLNTYLNSDYYNTLSETAKNMIGTTKYYLGGYSAVDKTSDATWQYERKKANGSDCVYDSSTNKQTGTECYYFYNNPIMQSDASKSIALMYASDYIYATSKECIESLEESCQTTSNWLYKSGSGRRWFLFPDTKVGNSVFAVDYAPNFYSINLENKEDSYPTLTLSSKVQISDGEGTINSPYQLTLTQ